MMEKEQAVSDYKTICGVIMEEEKIDKAVKDTIGNISLTEVLNPFKYDNQEILTLLILLCCLLFSSYYVSQHQNQSTINHIAKITENKQILIKNKLPSDTIILKKINSKNLFKTALNKRPEIKKTRKEKGVNINKKLKEYIFRGVISDDSSKAVIESKKTNKTYFVEKGQIFSGIEVISISQNQVTVKYGGKEGVVK